MKVLSKPVPGAGPTVLKGQIKLQPVANLQPYAGNARRHSKDQIRRLAEAIQEFGFVVPILVDEHNGVLAGHARLEAAKKLNMPEVATLCVSHLSQAQRQAYVIADNRLAELASWDKPVLIDELNKLLKLDFQLETTGFATPELDLLLRVVDEDEDGVEPQENAPPVAARVQLASDDHAPLCERDLFTHLALDVPAGAHEGETLLDWRSALLTLRRHATHPTQARTHAVQVRHVDSAILLDFD